MTVKQGWTGRFFEDFAVGDVYQHPLGRTVTRDRQHLVHAADDEHQPDALQHASTPARSEFGRPLVVSTLTVAIAVGQSVTDLTQNAFANLGWDDIKMTAPGLRRRHPLQRVAGAGEARVGEPRRTPASSPCGPARSTRTATRSARSSARSTSTSAAPSSSRASSRRARVPLGLDDRRPAMSLRLTFQPWGETLAELADAGRRAEAAGAEVLWASELHRSATVTAAALAQATTPPPGSARRSRSPSPAARW